MSSRYIKRILSDIKEIEKDKENGIYIFVLNDYAKRLKSIITGPEGSCYEGGSYYLDITMPDNYPIVPPTVKFETKIWHPNISSATGCICLDILQKKWRPVLSLKAVLLSIKILLTEPNPNDPQDSVVAKQFMENRKLFIKTAKFWTKEFANGNNDNVMEFNEKIEFFEKKGFERKKIITVLSWNDWVVETITHDLFTN